MSGKDVVIYLGGGEGLQVCNLLGNYHRLASCLYLNSYFGRLHVNILNLAYCSVSMFAFKDRFSVQSRMFAIQPYGGMLPLMYVLKNFLFQVSFTWSFSIVLWSFSLSVQMRKFGVSKTLL